MSSWKPVVGGSGQKSATALPNPWFPESSTLDSRLKQCQGPSKSPSPPPNPPAFFLEVIWEATIIFSRSGWTVSSDSLSGFFFDVGQNLYRSLDILLPPLPPWDEVGIRLASEEWIHSPSGHHPSAANQNKHRFSAARLLVKIGKGCCPGETFGIGLSLYQCSAKHSA